MTARRQALLLAAMYLVVVALQVAGMLARNPYDDAWFFERFAHNFLHHGVFAWNAQDGPVYGNTSQLFQLAAVGVEAAVPGYYAAGIRVLSAVALVVALWCMVRLSARDEETSTAGCALLFCSPVVLYTALSGMETALVVLALAAFLLLLRSDRHTGWRCVLVPGAMVGIYLLRPDAVLLVGIAWAWDRVVVRRQLPWREAVAFVVLLVATLAILKAYYGTALPLSFYLKSSGLTVYGKAFVALSEPDKHQNILLFAVVSLPVVYLSLWRLDRKNAGLVVAALVFLAFHYFSTIEVMGGHARFYAPAIPLVAAAAMTGSDRPPSWRRLGFHLVFAIAYTVLVWWLFQHRWIPDNKVWNINRVAPALYVAYVAGAWLLVLSPRKLAGAATYAILFVSMVGLWVAHPFSTRSIPSDEAYLAAELGHRSGFHGIDRLARCIGPNIAIYHSEIGLPGVAMPEAEITDLVGLMTPAFAFGDVSFDDYCLADPPEAIFLPHRNYKRLRHAVQSSQCLRGYVRITKGGSPLYIRRDLMASLRACPGR